MTNDEARIIVEEERKQDENFGLFEPKERTTIQRLEIIHGVDRGYYTDLLKIEVVGLDPSYISEIFRYAKDKDIRSHFTIMWKGTTNEVVEACAHFKRKCERENTEEK